MLLELFTVTRKYVARTNVIRQDDYEQPQIAAPSPRPLSKPVRSKIKRHQRRKSDSSLLHKDPTRYPTCTVGYG